MVEYKKTTYKCEYCRRLMQVKNACIKHELICAKNPDNFIKCIGCNNCEEIIKEVYNDGYYGEYTREVKSFYCKAKEVNMYPPKALHLVGQYPESFEDEVLMPKECDFFTSEINF